MKIAIDIDDVTTEFMRPLTGLINQIYKTETNFDDIQSWNTARYFGITNEQFRGAIKTFTESGGFSRVQPEFAAVDAIKELQAQGHELYFLSARNSRGISDTYRWFADRGLPTERMFFDRDKKWQIEHHGIDMLIDDAPHNILAAQTVGAVGVLYTQPWNQAMRNTQWRANGWPHVVEIVSGVARGKEIERQGVVPDKIWKHLLPEVYEGQ